MDRPARIEFEVRTPHGQLAYTSPDLGLAKAWADAHCGPHAPLAVERVALLREQVYVAHKERAA